MTLIDVLETIFLCLVFGSIIAYSSLELPDQLRRRKCKRKGHDWEFYSVANGYYSYDVEQAGYCKRCGEDTHGKYFYAGKEGKRWR